MQKPDALEIARSQTPAAPLLVQFLFVQKRAWWKNAAPNPVQRPNHVSEGPGEKRKRLEPRDDNLAALPRHEQDAQLLAPPS